MISRKKISEDDTDQFHRRQIATGESVPNFRISVFQWTLDKKKQEAQRKRFLGMIFRVFMMISDACSLRNQNKRKGL